MQFDKGILLGLIFLSQSLIAIDLGVHGHTYPIEEENFLVFVQSQLEKVSSQDFKEFQIKLPKGIKFPAAKKRRIFLYDPTIHAKKDILDRKGNIIVKKGTQYNPLQKYSLGENLLFLDGTDQSQIAWAKKTEGEWILTNGNPFSLEEEEERPIFFDQFGALIRKLGIQSLPARVSQEGMNLKIEEVSIQ